MERLRVPFCMRRTGWFVVLVCLLLGVSIHGWRLGLPEGLLILASLLLHEIGHMVAAASLKVPVREFGLELRGSYVRRAYASRRRDEILIAAAGPLVNLLIVIPIAFLPHLGPEVAFCNLMIGATNLLPLPSSDGLRILRNLTGSTVAHSANPALDTAAPR